MRQLLKALVNRKKDVLVILVALYSMCWPCSVFDRSHRFYNIRRLILFTGVTYLSYWPFLTHFGPWDKAKPSSKQAGCLYKIL